MKDPTPGNETHVRMQPTAVNSGLSLPGFVKCVTLPANTFLDARTVLIMQRHLLTMIETQINREEAIALANALVTHFGITAEELDNEEDKF